MDDIQKYLQSIERRTFLRILSFTGIAGLAYPRSLLSSLTSSKLSRVVIVEETQATSGTSINSDMVQVMVDAGIKILTKENDLSEAWKIMLPGINPGSIIAIKVNCINGALPTHPEVTYAVVNTLKQMNFDGTSFPENNIVIFDRTTNELRRNGGYKINTSENGVRCFGTDNVGYSGQTYDVSHSPQKLSKIVTEIVDYLINISVLKNHNISGVTLCMKNHYGTCHDPDGLHNAGNHADPQIPALNALPPIKDKQKVNICDALFGVRYRGPGGSPDFTANKILFSQDVVALDYWGREILKDRGCNTISDAHYIDTAAQDYGLGTNDPAQMDVVNVPNPTSGIDHLNAVSGGPDAFTLEQNFPNPFNSSTRIRFHVSRSAHVSLKIFNSNGRYVRTLIHKQLAAGSHQVQWDSRNHSGKPVSSGIYLCQLTAEGFQKSIMMHLIR